MRPCALSLSYDPQYSTQAIKFKILQPNNSSRTGSYGLSRTKDVKVFTGVFTHFLHGNQQKNMTRRHSPIKKQSKAPHDAYKKAFTTIHGKSPFMQKMQATPFQVQLPASYFNSTRLAFFQFSLLRSRTTVKEVLHSLKGAD